MKIPVNKSESEVVGYLRSKGVESFQNMAGFKPKQTIQPLPPAMPEMSYNDIDYTKNSNKDATGFGKWVVWLVKTFNAPFSWVFYRAFWVWYTHYLNNRLDLIEGSVQIPSIDFHITAHGKIINGNLWWTSKYMAGWYKQLYFLRYRYDKEALMNLTDYWQKISDKEKNR